MGLREFGSLRLTIQRRLFIRLLRVENYLFKICHNEFLIYIRKKKKENSLLDELKFDIAQKIYTPFDHTESKINQIEIVLAKLSKRSREAFVLSKVDNLKYTEIAEEMGIYMRLGGGGDKFRVI
jgi:RNA polymerase sigma-70 factor (ECF subfamily)